MWKLTINGRLHNVIRPHWIRQMNRLGVTLVMTATEKNAQGVQFNGTIYQLADREPMDGEFASASVEWVEQPTPPEPTEPTEPDTALEERVYRLEEYMGIISGVR